MVDPRRWSILNSDRLCDLNGILKIDQLIGLDSFEDDLSKIMLNPEVLIRISRLNDLKINRRINRHNISLIKAETVNLIGSRRTDIHIGPTKSFQHVIT